MPPPPPSSHSSLSSAPQHVPSVPLSFSNNFWGPSDAGVTPLLSRMSNAKLTLDELKTFYSARLSIEEDYARKLLALARKPLGSSETGTLRASLDVVRGEAEAMGKSHGLTAQQMRSELEEPLAAFAGGLKERRKIVQSGVERILKTKQAQLKQVQIARDRYEQDCLRIKGYLAQGHMVMGQEERKNKVKLEKSQISMAGGAREYEVLVKEVEETVGRWNKEWKSACDKFQDLEEERLDFMKSSLWAYANIASTVCVTDDASCEKVRVSLEGCEVEKDISGFIRMCGTGQEIPDPPRYINFCRGDVESASEAEDEEGGYAVAQFQRTTNPAFRSSSPNPSASGQGQRANEEPVAVAVEEDDERTPSKANSGRPPPLNYRQHDPNVPPNYSPSQHGDVTTQIPHNEYPTEGMTMFCRAGPPSVTGSGLSANTRPSSRDSQSECSVPTSYTSADPMSGKNSPTKGMPPVNGVEMPGMASPEKLVQKKRSGFFSNSPFRRKSKRETENPVSNRNTWNPSASSRINLTPSNVSSSSHGGGSQQGSPTKSSTSRPGPTPFNRAATVQMDDQEPVDPRASFQLNVGNNVFDVASPDWYCQTTPRANTHGRDSFQSSAPGDSMDLDPVAQALADLKSATGNSLAGMNKQASQRVTVDRYAGIKTPAPPSADGRPPPISAASADRLAAQRGTPPPAYEGTRAPPASALRVPQPAFTSKEMRKRTEDWGGQSQSQYGQSAGPMRSRSPGPGMRATSPQPMRARSPGPQMMGGQNGNMRARSPGPGTMNGQNANMRARSPGPSMMQQQGQGQYRAASPNPYGGGRSQARPQPQPRQGSGLEMQLSSQDVQRYDQGSGRSRQSRPNSSYGGEYAGSEFGGSADGRGRGSVDPQMRKERSKSMAAPSRAGPAFYARALYSYAAAIPEELTFAKGDILAVLRLQDDGWWEAEVSQSQKGPAGRQGPGLVPSNYLQRC